MEAIVPLPCAADNGFPGLVGARVAAYHPGLRPGLGSRFVVGGMAVDSSTQVEIVPRMSGDAHGDTSDLVALYLRVAATLTRSAELAERHAQRERANGRRGLAGIELERARRAREAARRGRALAARLQ